MLTQSLAELTEESVTVVQGVVRYYRRRLDRRVSTDDLLEWALEGLARALPRLSEFRSVRERQAYLWRVLRGAVLDALRERHTWFREQNVRRRGHAVQYI